MNPIHKLVCSYTIDLRKLGIVSAITDNSFFVILDYDVSMTIHGNNEEGIDIYVVHTELLKAWQDYSNINAGTK